MYYNIRQEGVRMRNIFSVVIKLTFLFCVTLPLKVFAQQIKDISSGKTTISQPPIVIYKMKRDYSRNVPVLLSDDKSEIVSYPHPMDLIGMTSKEVMPIRLHDGYYLDRRGINKNVAFLTLTYRSYSKLRKPLSIDQIKRAILDKDPLVEMYMCNRISPNENIIQQVNEMIDKNELSVMCK